MNLPTDFLNKMQTLLQEEYPHFLNSYQQDRVYGLRVNPIKIDKDTFEQLSPFELQPIPWAKEGFYYNKQQRPGKHPYHEAGLYYIQEPSAMAVVELLNPQPGENILDLCAAPGGKSTQIAAKLNQQGFLLSNEIHTGRAKILSQNVERMGIQNAVVSNESPAHLAELFPQYFDRILVDAPCSGEGMFRKDEQARQEWTPQRVLQCAQRQLEILNHAAQMLRPGGCLVYSTCTFSPEENEHTIQQFLTTHQAFYLEKPYFFPGFDTGKPEWISDGTEDLKNTVRLFPHHLQGEGHYIAVLKKNGMTFPSKDNRSPSSKPPKELQDFLTFAKDTLLESPQGNFQLFGDQLYLVPEQMPSFKQFHTIRPGWHLGTLKKNRFEPAHALALSLKPEQVIHHCNLNLQQAIDYLSGNTLSITGEKGWYLVCVDGYSLGWGKVSNQTLKNHYPKGLRWMGVSPSL